MTDRLPLTALARDASPEPPDPPLPIAGPRREVVVVLDEDPILQFWSAEIEDFEAVLRAQSGVASVERATIAVDREGRLRLGGGMADPGSLAAGRAVPPIVFLVTHGQSSAWRRGLLSDVLFAWSEVETVAVVNLLRQQHWHDRGLPTKEVTWTPGDPLAPTAGVPWELAGLDLRSAEEREADANRVAVPMLELGRDWLRNWSRLLAGPGAGEVSMPALLVAPGERPMEEDPDPGNAAALVARFRAGASPQAFTLATRLAAAPLNARVMRALERTALRSGPLYLTEVLTSGLLRPSRHERGLGDTRIAYEFVHGVRERLLGFGYRDRIIEIQHMVEGALARDVEAVRNLALRVQEPQLARYHRISPAAEPYLRVELAVHLSLGGPNLTAARQLGLALGVPVPSQKRRTLQPGRLPDSRMESRMSDTMPSQGSSAKIGTEPHALDIGRDVEGGAMAGITTAVGPRTVPRLPAIVGNLPPRNVNFTGRAELLDALHERLRAGTTAVLPEAVHGAGGVGKSQLVVEYVYRHQQDFDLIWWIAAERQAQIQPALAELAQQLELPVPATANTAVPAVLEALRLGRPYSNWLLIFDNAENPEDVQRFFPERGPGSIVVTSRNPQWGALANSLPVDVFDRQESIELMRRRDPALAVDRADRLAEVLGDLPLALEAAAAWRAEKRMTVDDYLALLEQSRHDLEQQSRAMTDDDYPPMVAAVWNISLSGLGELDPAALRLLQMCAFFAPEPIGRVLLSKPRALRIDDVLDPLVRNRARLDQAIRTIGRLALARIDHRTNSFQMHRLVQRVLLQQMDPADKEKMRHSAHLLLAGNDPDQPDETEHWARYAELYPHIVASSAEDCPEDLVRDMILNEARYLWRWGDHTEARKLSERAHAAWTQSGAESDPYSLRMAFWLGWMYFVVGDYAAAAAINARTLELYRETLGEGAEETLNALGAVASDHRVAGDFAGALERSQAVYEQAKATFGEEEPFTLQQAHNLAVSMRLSGIYGRALQIDEQTYQRRALIFGTDYPDSLDTAGGVNLDRRELGDYVKAHLDQESVVATARRVLRYEEHPFLLRQSHQLASFRRKAGLHHEALDLSSDVLRRFRSRYGDKHPDTVLAILQVSIDQRVTGDLAAARKSGTTAVDGLRELYGEQHPHTAGAKSDLAVTLRLLGEFEEARTLDEEALRDLSERLSDEHPLVLLARINLASDLYELRDYAAAHALDTENFTRCKRLLGKNHPTTLACGVNLAMDMRNVGREPEASDLFDDMLDRFRDTLGEVHPASAAAAAGVRANCDIDPLPL